MSIYIEYMKKELLSRGIDISDKNYKESEAYKAIKDQRILGCEGGSMSYEEFIERYILEQWRVSHTYESIYDMGNKTILTDDDCEDIAVAKEIIEKESVNEKNIDAEAGEFVKKFYRSGGLIERLKNYMDLDLDGFENKDERYKRERCKILYFFYMLEHHYFSNVNVLNLLSKPSMENIDNSLIGMKTFNGMIIGMIKDSLEKELDLSVKKEIRTGVEKITRDWDQVFDNIRMLTDFFYMRGLEYDLEETIHVLFLDTKFSKAQSVPKYTLSPIETLYLKVVQHEHLGNVLDIDKINNIKNDYGFNVSQDLVEEMKSLNYKPVDFKNIEQFIEDNAHELSKYVYLSKNVSKEDVRRIKTFKKKIPKLINFILEEKPLLHIKDISNELQLISMLQAIILDAPSEIFDYTFYGYQNNSSHKKRVQAALKNEDYVPQALRRYWERKIADHWYANLGRYDERVKLRKMEQACDSIITEILRKPNLDEMQETHKYYMERLDDELITTKWQIQAVECFEKDLRDKGFKYVDDSYKIRYVFLYPPEIRGTYRVLIDMIDIAINDSDPSLDVELESSSANGDEKLKVNFRLEFDYIRNKCTMGGMNITELDSVQ